MAALRRSSLVGLAVVAVALVLGAGVFLVVGLGPSAPAFDIDGPEVARARQAAVTELSAELDAFEERAGNVRPSGELGWQQECRPGQHNWKVKDEHARTCSLTLVRAYVFDGDFTTGARRIVAALDGPSCRAPRESGEGYGSDAVEHLERDLAALGVGADPGRLVDRIAGGPGPCGHGDGLAIGGWAALPVDVERLEADPVGVPRPCPVPTGDRCRDGGLDQVLRGDGPRGRWLVVVTAEADGHWTQEWDRSPF